jgi:hypothetical protein
VVILKTNMTRAVATKFLLHYVTINYSKFKELNQDYPLKCLLRRYSIKLKEVQCLLQ